MHRITTAIAIGIVVFCALAGIGVAKRMNQTTISLASGTAIGLIVGILAAALLAFVLSRVQHSVTYGRQRYHDRQPDHRVTVQLPTPVRRMNVPVTFYNGRSLLEAQTVLTTSVERDSKRAEIGCNIRTLHVAVDILSRGQQPTRQAFNEHGIMASPEIRAAVDYLRIHGFINPGIKDAPARWTDGASAESLTQWLNQWAGGNPTHYEVDYAYPRSSHH